MMISFGRVFEDSISFIQREKALLVPLALATFVLGDAGRTLAGAAMEVMGQNRNLGVSLAYVGSMLLALLGQLATIALVLRPGMSLKEAFELGLSRLPRVILIGMFLLGLLLMMVLPVLIVLARGGYDLTAAQPEIPPAAAFYILLVSAFGTWIAVRLTLLTAHIVDAKPGIAEALRAGFLQTKGMTLRLFGCFFFFLFFSLFVTTLSVKAFNLLFKGIGDAIGMAAIGNVMSAFAVSLVTGALSLFATVFVAHLYRAVASLSSKGI
jgi:hypothetical protein